MALNLKNDETERLARELATLTGETLTHTVTIAVQERLERIRRQAPLAVQLRQARILALGCEIANALGADGMQVEDLYDDHLGLPS